MDIESIFFTIFTIWYFSRYIPEDTLNTLYRLHAKTTEIVELYNRVFFPLYFLLDEDELKEETVEEEEVKTVVKPEIKYEDKFYNLMVY